MDPDRTGSNLLPAISYAVEFDSMDPRVPPLESLKVIGSDRFDLVHTTFCISDHSINQSINQFNSNLAAREPDSK